LKVGIRVNILVVGTFGDSPSRVLDRIRKKGFAVTHVSSCEDAWRALGEDASLGAVAIEGETGAEPRAEFLRQMSQDDRFKDLPVFFLEKKSA
jgi:hypothetical protein